MKSLWMKIIALGLSTLILSGCLRTRTDIETAQTAKMQELQQDKAEMTLKMEELQTTVREMVGRIDSLESENTQAQADVSATSDKEDKFKLFEQALLSLEGQVKELRTELDTVKKQGLSNSENLEKIKAAKVKKSNENIPKGNYARGQYFYNLKDWRKAIGGYEKYRELNPQGRKYLDATLKIGECFQELGMSTEAKVFFDEVIEKKPKSSEAKKARNRLQALAK